MLPRGLLKEYSQALAILLRTLDALAVVLAGWGAYFYKFDDWHLPDHYQAALLASAIVTTVIFHFFDIYQSIRAKTFWQYLSKMTQAVGVLLMFLAGLAFITKTGETYSRAWFGLWSVLAFILLFAFRVGLLLFLRFMRAQGLNERSVMVIGAGELSHQLVATVQQALWTGFRIVSIIDVNTMLTEKDIAGIPIVNMPDDISLYLKTMEKGIDEIWLALPMRDEERVKTILHELRHHTVTTRFVLDIHGLDLSNRSITNLAGFPTLNLNATPMVGINRIIKAIEDRMLAAIILLLISPLLILIAIAVKCTSKGPVLFKQLRHGWDGRIIKIYKFRTMYLHEDVGVTQAKADDKRITGFGRFLRRTSLDELPQFFNVLQGKMSIVGPRPHAVLHNEYYKDSIKAYMQRHKVKPGVTGWAQVNGFRGETDTLEKMQKRVEHDLYYIENWSLLFDFKIILLTLFRGFVGKNAY